MKWKVNFAEVKVKVFQCSIMFNGNMTLVFSENGLFI